METLEKSKNYFMRTGFNESDNFTTLVHISWLSNKQLCFQPLFPNAESFKPIEDQVEKKNNFLMIALFRSFKILDIDHVNSLLRITILQSYVVESRVVDQISGTEPKN